MLLAIPSTDRLERVLKYLLNEEEFLSPFGIRSVSRKYKDHPFVFTIARPGILRRVRAGRIRHGLFGGNSNWRGPIWFPLNFLLVEALQRYHFFYGDELKVEFPTGSGKMLNLAQVAYELNRRLANLFLPDANHRRPCHGDDLRYANDPAWRIWFCFTNISTAITAGASGRATRPVGRAWSQNAWKTSRRTIRGESPMALMPAKLAAMPGTAAGSLSKQVERVGGGQPS